MWLFQLYFYRNLVTLLSDSQILNEDELNKGTIEKLLTEIFTLDEQENEQEVEKFDKEGGEIYRVSYPDSNNNLIIEMNDLEQSIIFYWKVRCRK